MAQHLGLSTSQQIGLSLGGLAGAFGGVDPGIAFMKQRQDAQEAETKRQQAARKAKADQLSTGLKLVKDHFDVLAEKPPEVRESMINQWLGPGFERLAKGLSEKPERIMGMMGEIGIPEKFQDLVAMRVYQGDFSLLDGFVKTQLSDSTLKFSDLKARAIMHESRDPRTGKLNESKLFGNLKKLQQRDPVSYMSRAYGALVEVEKRAGKVGPEADLAAFGKFVKLYAKLGGARAGATVTAKATASENLPLNADSMFWIDRATGQAASPDMTLKQVRDGNKFAPVTEKGLSLTAMASGALNMLDRYEALAHKLLPKSRGNTATDLLLVQGNRIRLGVLRKAGDVDARLIESLGGSITLLSRSLGADARVSDAEREILLGAYFGTEGTAESAAANTSQIRGILERVLSVFGTPIGRERKTRPVPDLKGKSIEELQRMLGPLQPTR